MPSASSATLTVPRVPFVVSRFRSNTFLHQPPILETMDPSCVNVETSMLGTTSRAPGVTGTTLTTNRRAGRARRLPSIYGQSDTLCKSEHF